LIDEICAVNHLPEKIGIRDIETDVLFIREYYAEPVFRYKEQENHWKQKPKNITSMAHSKKFSDNDIKSTTEFIGPIADQISGDNVLDICSGMSRC